MNYVLIDVETDGLDYTKIHCIAAQEVDVDATPLLFTDVPTFNQWVTDRSLETATYVAHNGCGFDFHVLNELTVLNLGPDQMVDTSVLSKLRDYEKFNTHSLKELGQYLGVYKGDYTGGWDRYTPEMGKYCVQDVVVLEAIFKWLMTMLTDPVYEAAIDTEQRTALLCEEMRINGFPFDKDEAHRVLAEVEADMAVLERSFATSFPPKRVVDKTCQLRRKSDGSYYANVVKDFATYADVEIDSVNETYTCWTLKPFNPGSPTDRIDVLWDAGWKPYDKTKGHLIALRKKDHERIKDHYAKYGWRCNEDNLRTLPDSAPQAAKDLAMWLTLEGRRSALAEWIGHYNDSTGRIHGTFWHIGAWTHRMAHSKPNQANIPSVFTEKPKSPVEEIKAKYDGRLRELWHAPKGAWLVGTDAESIQLRILCHYIESAMYRDAITSGDKSKGTDIHTVNQKILGARTRDSAKRFIYAWLLGGGLGKLASLLDTNIPKAKRMIEKFLDDIPELKRLRQKTIKRDALRGFFYGLDGRKVKCKSTHLMMSGYLQNGEAVIMKLAMLKWSMWAFAEGISFQIVDFVHDEWQTIVFGDKKDAERLGELQCKALEEVGDELGLFCPLAGSSTIGTNWKETH